MDHMPTIPSKQGSLDTDRTLGYLATESLEDTSHSPKMVEGEALIE